MIKTIRAEHRFFKGQKLARLRDWENSIRYFDLSISLRPNIRGIYLHKAISMSMQKKFSEALSIIEKEISLNPENHANYLFQGIIFYDSGDYDKALKAFEKSLKLSPGNSLLKCYIALTQLYRNERITEAHEELLSEIQNTNPDYQARFLIFCENFLLNHKELARSLEDIFFVKSNLEKSKTKLFNSLVDKLSLLYINLFGIFNANKKKYYLHQLSAKKKLQEGDVDYAIKELKKSLSYYFEFNEALIELLSIYFYQKDFQSVIENIEQLEEYKNINNRLFNIKNQKKKKEQISAELKNHLPLILILGLYYYHSEDLKKAIDIFSVIIDSFPNDFYNNYHLGLSYLGLGDNENAFNYFRGAFQLLNQNAVKLRLEEMIRVNRIVSNIP